MSGHRKNFLKKFFVAAVASPNNLNYPSTWTKNLQRGHNNKTKCLFFWFGWPWIDLLWVVFQGRSFFDRLWPPRSLTLCGQVFVRCREPREPDPLNFSIFNWFSDAHVWVKSAQTPLRPSLECDLDFTEPKHTYCSLTIRSRKAMLLDWTQMKLRSLVYSVPCLGTQIFLNTIRLLGARNL